MAETRHSGVDNQLDLQSFLEAAEHRWLSVTEVCEVLRNYKKFKISEVAPNAPPSGSLFLFDSNVLKKFRNDGHSWRKKQDGKTVAEVHEKLKVGGVNVLSCYYAQMERNPRFQRRVSKMLDEDLSHIALVQYREITPSEFYNREQRQMKIEKIIAAINLTLELPSAVLEQLSSVNKHYTALILMLLSFMALFIGIIEFAQKGRRRGWKRGNKDLMTLQHSSVGKIPFWSFSNIVGFACAICQCMFSAINYALVLRRVNIHIQIAVMPIIFAFVQLWFKLRDKPEHIKSNPGEA